MKLQAVLMAGEWGWHRRQNCPACPFDGGTTKAGPVAPRHRTTAAAPDRGGQTGAEPPPALHSRFPEARRGNHAPWYVNTAEMHPRRLLIQLLRAGRGPQRPRGAKSECELSSIAPRSILDNKNVDSAPSPPGFRSHIQWFQAPPHPGSVKPAPLRNS